MQKRRGGISRMPRHQKSVQIELINNMQAQGIRLVRSKLFPRIIQRYWRLLHKHWTRFNNYPISEVSQLRSFNLRTENASIFITAVVRFACIVIKARFIRFVDRRRMRTSTRLCATRGDAFLRCMGMMHTAP